MFESRNRKCLQDYLTVDHCTRIPIRSPLTPTWELARHRERRRYRAAHLDRRASYQAAATDVAYHLWKRTMSYVFLYSNPIYSFDWNLFLFIWYILIGINISSGDGQQRLSRLSCVVLVAPMGEQTLLVRSTRCCKKTFLFSFFVSLSDHYFLGLYINQIWYFLDPLRRSKKIPYLNPIVIFGGQKCSSKFKDLDSFFRKKKNLLRFKMIHQMILSDFFLKNPFRSFDYGWEKLNLQDLSFDLN